MRFIVDTCAWIRAVSTKDTYADLQNSLTIRESQKEGDPKLIRKEISSRLYNGEKILVTKGILEELQTQKNRLPQAEKDRLERIITLLQIIIKTTSQPSSPKRDPEGLSQHDNAIINLNRKFPEGSPELWNPEREETKQVLERKFLPTIRKIPEDNQRIFKNQLDPTIAQKKADLMGEIEKLHNLTIKEKLEGLTKKETEEKTKLENNSARRNQELKKIDHLVNPRIWTDMETAIHAVTHHATLITADSDVFLLHEVLPLRFQRIQANPYEKNMPFETVTTALENSIKREAAQEAGLTQSKRVRTKTPQEAAALEKEAHEKGGKVLNWSSQHKEILTPPDQTLEP